MKTSEDLARADAVRADSAPEVDERVIRCRCGHSLGRHHMGGPVSALRCRRCRCDRFITRPAAWRVTLKLRVQGSPPLWQITSPRGVQVMHFAGTQGAAMRLARHYASIDYMLAQLIGADRGPVGEAMRRHPAGRLTVVPNGGGRA